MTEFHITIVENKVHIYGIGGDSKKTYFVRYNSNRTINQKDYDYVVSTIPMEWLKEGLDFVIGNKSFFRGVSLCVMESGVCISEVSEEEFNTLYVACSFKDYRWSELIIPVFKSLLSRDEKEYEYMNGIIVGENVILNFYKGEKIFGSKSISLSELIG